MGERKFTAYGALVPTPTLTTAVVLLAVVFESAPVQQCLKTCKYSYTSHETDKATQCTADLGQLTVATKIPSVGWLPTHSTLGRYLTSSGFQAPYQ